MPRKYLSLLGSLLLPTCLLAQNLVLNGNFDEENICAEYHQACSPVGWKQTSYQVIGYYRQYLRSFSGDHFLPVIVENKIDPRFRTYWQTRLLCPLQPGKRYQIRFHLAVWGGDFIPADLGICFSSHAWQQADNVVLPLKAQVRFREEEVWSKPGEPWMEIRTSYQAHGGERFLIIGNFLLPEDMIPHEPYTRSIITYCIDDFSLEPMEGCGSCPDSALLAADLRADIYRHSPPPAPAPEKKDTTVQQPGPPMIAVSPAADTFRLGAVLFAFDSSSILPAFQPLVDSIARVIQQRGYDTLEVRGHTDDRGPAVYNLQLSLRRAEAVADRLIRQGCAAERIRVSGLGEAEPLLPNTQEENRRRNRRVEIIIHRKKGR